MFVPVQLFNAGKPMAISIAMTRMAQHGRLSPNVGCMLQVLDLCNVQAIDNKFNTPEKSQSSHRGDSPRWSRNRSLGTRSRHAQRALGVFSSRSFSAGASGGSPSSKLRGSVATQDCTSEHCSSEPPGQDGGHDDTRCSRRLSMGDPRVSGPGPIRTSITVRSRLQ